MALVYKFRITFEDYDEIFRDIEIKSNQYFSDLHDCIQKSIGFDGSKPASFYMSNDFWIKGKEISTETRTSKEGITSVLMNESRLCDFIADPHQKIYYISDYVANWCFMIELVKIIPAADQARTYPSCVKSTGEAPKQFLIVPSPKAVISGEDEFAKLLEGEVDDTEDEPADTLMEESQEEGVEEEELSGMGEEGEEDEMQEEGEEGEGFESADEDQREEY